MEYENRLFFNTDRDVICELAHIQGVPWMCLCKNKPECYSGAALILDWKMKGSEDLNLKHSHTRYVDWSCLFIALRLL